MSTYEPPRFRITTSPSIVVAPTRVAVPRTAGLFFTYDDVLDFVDGRLALTHEDGTQTALQSVREASHVRPAAELFALGGRRR